MITIKQSRIHGKGVFAECNLYKGQILTCDVLLIDKKDYKVLRDHQFPWDREHSSICIGFGSYLNHSDSPNVRILSIDKVNLTKSFIVLGNLEPGQELTIEYGKGWDFNASGTSVYKHVPSID